MNEGQLVNNSENQNDFPLVPRPSSAVEKAAPGAKRILSCMVVDTLALIKASANSLFEKGEFYSKSGNFAEAFACYRKAADQGNAKAQNKVGLCFYFGWGVAEDKHEAVNWFSKSTRQGNTDSPCFLGQWHIETDYAEAYKWLTLAFEQGDKRAASGLATLRSWMTWKAGIRKARAASSQKSTPKP
jgi:TPR repeat protein